MTNPSTLEPPSEDKRMETLTKPWTENSDNATTIVALDQGLPSSLHTSLVTNKSGPNGLWMGLLQCERPPGGNISCLPASETISLHFERTPLRTISNITFPIVFVRHCWWKVLVGVSCPNSRRRKLKYFQEHRCNCLTISG